MAIEGEVGIEARKVPDTELAPAQSVFSRLWGALRRPNSVIRCGMAPALHTPLSDIRAMVFDTETTGLNVRSDRIISAAGFHLESGLLATDPSFDLMIDPGRSIPAASTAFHGIVDAMVHGKGGFANHWPEIHRHLEIGLLIGHQIYFDVTLLGREVRRLRSRLQPPVALDTALLYAALHPSHRHRDLTFCCAEFGIDIPERHSARGDAAATGALFLKLVPLLAEHGIHTLGEALAFERAAIFHHPRRWQF